MGDEILGPTVTAPFRHNVPAGNTKYLIIGGGTAAFAAIQSIRELDPDSKVTVIAKEDELPYMRPPLSKELWFSEGLGRERVVEGLEFVDWHNVRKSVYFEEAGYYREKGVEVILGMTATDIDLPGKRVLLRDGRSIGFERALIATGGEPKTLSALESLGSRVTTFRGAQDFRRLYELLAGSEEGKHVVVIGGGFLGSELAVAMSRHAKTKHKVTQIFPEDGHMGLVFPKYLSQWTMDKISGLGVGVKNGCSVERARLRGEKVELGLSSGEKVVADHVVVAVGISPAVSFVPDVIARDRNVGGLSGDVHLQVSEGIFAAGDAVAYFDVVSGQPRRTEHFDHAVLSGKLAGRNMVLQSRGQALEPYRAQSMFWSDLGPEIGYEAVGLVDASLTTVGVWARASAADTPSATELDPSDIRAQPLGQTSISTTDPERERAFGVGKEAGTTTITTFPTGMSSISTHVSASSVPSFGKGVVFYAREGRIVGVLLFNLFNRVSLARDVLAQGRTVDDIAQLRQLFNIYEAV